MNVKMTSTFEPIWGVWREPPTVELSPAPPLFENFTNLTEATDLDFKLIEKFVKNARISQPWYNLLIWGYCSLILIGASGNCLLVAAVIRKPQMRTVRNVFVFNLAISDMLLCLVTMPLTLMEILTIHWPLGNNVLGCKIAGTLQGISIFVSTLSITAIALDRHQVIVNPTSKSLKMLGSVLGVVVIWIVAVVIALPNLIWRTLATHELNLPNLKYISFCYEEWPVEYGRAIYSTVSMVLQYCIPILTLMAAYARISRRLRGRLSSKNCYRRDDARAKKMTLLLIAIVVIFCLSWLPLNLYNIIVDMHNPFGKDTETMMITYALCHMAAMSSACSNPLLYGWLNGNFKQEFCEIFSFMTPCIDRSLQDNDGSRRDKSCSRASRGENISIMELYPKSIKNSKGKRNKSRSSAENAAQHQDIDAHKEPVTATFVSDSGVTTTVF